VGELGAIVIGAGQAGLAASYHLSQAGVGHVVLERGRIGETWRSQRWGTFVLNTPGWLSHVLLAERLVEGRDDGFLTAAAFAARLESFATRHSVPVRAGVTVTRVEPLRPPGGGFRVSMQGADGPDEAITRAVVVAGGIQNVPRVPSIAAAFPPGLVQLTTADYRWPGDLQAGAVLVVGGAQSGVQIAEDLLAAGRTVYLCTSRVGRLRRRYRGRDMIARLFDAGFYDVTPTQLPDPAMRSWPVPQTSGVGPLGHTVSLQGLADQGVTLLGRPVGVSGDRIELDDTVGANVAFGDRVSRDLKALVDDHLRRAGASLPPLEPDPADEPHPDPARIRAPHHVDLDRAGITTVVWACGFGGAFGYLPPEAVDASGIPLHVDGVGPLPGLVYVGFPWLSKRKSGIIPGVDEDAARVVTRVAPRAGRRGVRSSGRPRRA
jgi:putative flavoprotein involved in K+ transport